MKMSTGGEMPVVLNNTEIEDGFRKGFLVVKGVRGVGEPNLEE